jgi:hypothetical protein
MNEIQDVDMFCNLSDSQINTYSSALLVHSISDLAGNKDYQAFAIWIANILRDPSSVRKKQQNAYSKHCGQKQISKVKWEYY